MFEQLKSMLQGRGSVTDLPSGISDPQMRSILLSKRADEMLWGGRLREAVQCFDAALVIARDLAREHPADYRHPQMIASLQYSRASALTMLGRPAEAVAALDESEQRYREAGAANLPNLDLLIADVQARRGLAQHARGYGISAVLELDAAVIAYRQRFSGAQDDPCTLDLARVLAMNAHVLRTWGDPDLAVASADAALRLYMLAERTARYRAQAMMHMGYWRMAAEVAAELHAAHGRLQVAIAVDVMASAIARLAFDHNPTAQHRQALAAALARQGLHMRALDGSGDSAALIAQGQALDAQAARQMMAQWKLVQAGNDPVQITVATSLAVAAQELGVDRVPDTLATTLTRPAIDVALLSPSDRRSPEQAVDDARQLAEISLALWKTRRAEALRLGIEAHYLFAIASRMRTTAMRYRMCDYGPPWARVLLACAQEYESRRQVSTALDLASWAGGVAQQLLLLSVLDPDVRPLIRECMEQHGRLCIASGDRRTGNEILQQARQLGSV